MTEPFKAFCHTLVAVAVAPPLLYNAGQFLRDRHPRNGLNTLVYLGVLTFELKHVWDHLQSSGRGVSCAGNPGGPLLREGDTMTPRP